MNDEQIERPRRAAPLFDDFHFYLFGSVRNIENSTNSENNLT